MEGTVAGMALVAGKVMRRSDLAAAAGIDYGREDELAADRKTVVVVGDETGKLPAVHEATVDAVHRNH